MTDSLFLGPHSRLMRGEFLLQDEGSPAPSDSLVRSKGCLQGVVSMQRSQAGF